MSENGLSLKVLEAYTRDVGRGVARIDYDSMDTVSYTHLTLPTTPYV